MKKSIILWLVLTIFVAGCAKNYDSFALCLTDSGAVMYGTSWCPHCTSQKEMFGKSFRLVNYVDCDLDRKSCDDAGISGLPTWIINDKKIEGTQELWQLAGHSKCTLEE